MEEKLSSREVAGPGRGLLAASDVGYTPHLPAEAEAAAEVPAGPRHEDTKGTLGCARLWLLQPLG